MRVLVTGHKGYIGSVLVPFLINKGCEVVGLDTDYFVGCELYPLKETIVSIRKDVREVTRQDLEGVNAIIHLAALSNDPLGELAPQLTDDINYKGTVHLARVAKAVGVERFIYSSSQSMYGISNVDEELDEDLSSKNPVTAYARTKWEAECELKKLNSDKFVTTCFRPSTVFGPSPRLRCDIVFNNLVASAFTTGKIEIKSDGTPWRPVVHIEDVSQAFYAGLKAPQEIISGQSFNVGIPNGNFSVRQLAEAAQKAVRASELVFTGEHGSDSRTYRVSFKKILTVLRDYYSPKWNLDNGGVQLVEFYRKVKLSEEDFRGRKCVRLKQIKYLMESGQLDNNLFWKSHK